MLRVDTQQGADAPADASLETSTSEQQSKPKARTSSWRSIGASKPKLLSEDDRVASDPTHAAPATKKQGHFASLFVSMLAVSPVAIDPEATDEQTMAAAQPAPTTETALPAVKPSKKKHTRHVSITKPSDIRRTRWERFMQGLGLKPKGRGKPKEKEEKKPLQAEEVALEEARAEEKPAN